MPSLHEAQYRHAKRYGEILFKANSLYEQGGKATKIALAHFDAERENTEVAFTWVSTNIQNDDNAAALCSAFLDAGLHLFELRQNPRDRIRWRNIAWAAARFLNNSSAEMIHLANLANAHAALGEHDDAIEFLKQALDIAWQLKKHYAIQGLLNTLSAVFDQLGDHHLTAKLLEQLLEQSRAANYRDIEVSTLCNLSAVYDNLGEFSKAFECCRQALNICRETGNLRTECAILINCGLVYVKIKNYQDALDFYDRALLIAREIRDLPGEARVLFNKSLVFAQWGQFDVAITHAEAALKLFEQIKDDSNMARVHR